MKKINRSLVTVPSKILSDGPIEHLQNITNVIAGNLKLIEKLVYKNKANKNEIRLKIYELSNGKCAYCETPFVDDYQLNIEHYRPILRVEYSYYDKFSPGYYWLSADWENLLPSCSACNSLASREVYYPELDKWIVATVGKGNRFPLYYSQNKKPEHSTGTANEVPLIFNPCTTNPKQIFQYVESINFSKGIIVTVIPSNGLNSIQKLMAIVSIEVLGLNRINLCRKRGVYTLTIKKIILDINLILSKSPFNKSLLADELLRLLPYIDIRKEEVGFSGLIIQFFYRDIRKIVKNIKITENDSVSLISLDDFVSYLRGYCEINYIIPQKPSPKIISNISFNRFFKP